MNNFIDFSIPQRQSLLGILVMFVNTLQKIVRAMWPLLLIWLVKIDSHNKLFIYGGILTFVLIIAVISYLQYYFFTFHIDKENAEFVIQKGVLNKTRITIQLHKIQQVNINQSLIQRFINVYKLEIDTAGSDKKEATISAISHELAIILKEELMYQSKRDSYIHQVDDTIELSSTQIKISLFSLIKIGFTSNYVKSFALLLLFFSTIMENIRQLSDNKLINEDDVSGYLNKFSLYSSIGIGVGIIIMMVLVLNLVRTVIKYFDFTIQKSKESILLSYGLLATKKTLLNPNKVQNIKITQNYFQKKLDILSIEVHQVISEYNKIKDKIEIPGCSKTESDIILEILYSKTPKKGVLFLPNWRKLVVNLSFLLVLPIIILLIVKLNSEFFTWIEWLIYSTIFMFFSGILIWFSYKNYQLFVSKDFIIKQNGAWDIDNTIVEPYKIQAITTQQFFWQKFANIGSVTLSTAGGNIDFTTGNFSQIKELVNYWLFQVENSKKNWM